MRPGFVPTCDRKWAVWRHRFEHLALTGRARPRLAIRVVNWCGYSQDFVAWPDSDRYCTLGAHKSAVAVGSRPNGMCLKIVRGKPPTSVSRYLGCTFCWAPEFLESFLKHVPIPRLPLIVFIPASKGGEATNT